MTYSIISCAAPKSDFTMRPQIGGSYPFGLENDYIALSRIKEIPKPKTIKCIVIGCHGKAIDYRKLCSEHYDIYCVTGIRKDCCNCEECKVD